MGSTHHLYAVTNGSLEWAFPPLNSGETIAFQSSPAIDANVYVGGMDGNFYEISNTGALIAAIPAPAPIVSSPVISSNSVTNLVIYASTDGSVFAQEIPTGLATNCDWPMFRRNPSHSARQDSGPILAHASGAPFPLINGLNEGLDSTGDFQFSVVGTPGTNWEVFTSTDFQTWSDTGIAAAMSIGPGPQLGTFSNNVAANTTEFFFMDSNGVCSKAIGFIETTLPAGTNLFSVPLYQINPNYTQTSAPNTLANLMPAGNYPGVEVDIWNGIELNAYTSDGPYWLLDGTNNSDGLLLPGQAARVVTTNSITITNVGLVRDGAEINGTKIT